MFRSNKERVTHKTLPSFEIDVNDGMGIYGVGFVEAGFVNNTEIKLTFSSEADKQKLVSFLKSRTEENSDKYPEMNPDEFGNTLVFQGEDAKQFAKQVLEDAKFVLPTDVFCEFADFFRDSARLQEQLDHASEQSRILEELHTNLSKILPSTDSYELGEDLDFSDILKSESNSVLNESDDVFELSPTDKIKKINEHNKEQYEAIKKQYLDLEKIIIDRNKVTNVIRSVLKKIIPILIPDGEKIFDSDLDRLKKGTAALSTPSTPTGNLDKCVTVEQLSKKVGALMHRAENDSSIEEHARALLRWVSGKFTALFKRAVSESSKDTQKIIRGIVPERRSSIFSPNSGELKSSDAHVNEQQGPRKK